MSTYLTLKQSLQIEQRTPSWYSRRKQLVTASEAASIIPNTPSYTEQYYLDFPDAKATKGTYCNPYCTKKEWFLRKTGDPRYKFQGNAATMFGQRYEPIAQMIYEDMAQTIVHEYGLIVSQKYPFLGASPDGVSEKNRMLEIKCPSLREINGVPPIYYYIQMQMQMEVCDFQVCDYFECRFDEYQDRVMYIADTSDSYRGCYIADLQTNQCYYPPKEFAKDPIKQDEWCIEFLNLDPDDVQNEYLQVVRWRLTKSFTTAVYRRQDWFVNLIIPLLEQAANIIKKPYIYKLFMNNKTDEEDTNEEVEVDGVRNELDFTTTRVIEEDCLPDIC